jgi:nitroreductase/NAD-dependent dihydropyrimidine dehydrogenase PreA subunit
LIFLEAAMKLLEVDQESCHQDGICAAVCPVGIIDFRKGAYPTPIGEAEELCVRCGHCVAVCPTGSLSHREMPVDRCPPIQKAFDLSAEHCEHFLRSRRSIRVYKDQPVPREEISGLIEVARYAPSGHNSQCAEWLVLDNRDELNRLAGIVADWARWMIDKMPQVALPMHMDKLLRRWEEGKDVILRDAPVVIVAHAEENNRMAPSTCTIALAYLELAAISRRLGCCWAGYFNVAATTFPPMKEALALPKGHQAFGSMMVGYPKFSYHRLPLRKPPPISWR